MWSAVTLIAPLTASYGSIAVTTQTSLTLAPTVISFPFTSTLRLLVVLGPASPSIISIGIIGVLLCGGVAHQGDRLYGVRDASGGKLHCHRRCRRAVDVWQRNVLAPEAARRERDGL